MSSSITIEGKILIDMPDVHAWIHSRRIYSGQISRIRFDIDADALVLEAEDKSLIYIDAAKLWEWVIKTQLPSGILHYETVFGLPKVEGSEFTITFATGSDGNPRSWHTPPTCLTEWKKSVKLKPDGPSWPV